MEELHIRTDRPRRKAVLFHLLLVLAAAFAVRLYRLSDLPLGAFVDEIFTLNSSLLLSETPFDPFGHTLAISQAWGKDHPNLFLYFNLLILKIVGVSYWSTKLLSVIPGVLATGLMFLIAYRLFDKRVALSASLVFAFAHWAVRLSRYGWDASLMLTAFAAAVWLLVLAIESGSVRYAVCSGIAGGLAVYSYLGGRIVLLSLLVFLGLECAVHRDRESYRMAKSFVAGAAAAALPFLFYCLSQPSAFWARTSEVSVFGAPRPFSTILTNMVRHELMFHWMGGTFARDNFPGLPMLDPLTGALFIGGLFLVIKRRDTLTRLLGCTLLLNLAGGVFSVSQEGAPYVYRTAAVIIPVFLLVGFGLQWLLNKTGTQVLSISTALIIVLNFYLYFGLEARNAATMRVMAYEPRLIGQEIARDNEPVWLVTPGVLTQTEVQRGRAEKYADANPAVILAPALRKLAIINFSGRYAMHETMASNLEKPKGMFFVTASDLPTRGPAKIIFQSGDPETNQAVARPGVSLRYIRNIFGDPLFTVASLSASN